MTGMSQNWPPQHIAVVYDRVNTRHGGAEVVLSAIHQAFPQAHLFTSVADLHTATWAQQFKTVQTSWLQKIPGAARLHRYLALLMPLGFELLDLKNYDLIISVTSAEAKGIITLPQQLHVCYLLAPPRYVYHQREEHLAAHWLSNIPGFYRLAHVLLNYLQWWDQVAIHRPDFLIPLSEKVAQQVRQLYGLPASRIEKVLYPPITLPPNETTVEEMPQPELPVTFFLQVARLVPYKKIALSMRCVVAANEHLIVVGDGPDKNTLIQLAETLNKQGPGSVTLISSASTEELQRLYRNCQAVLVPGEEDFGLTALEANAAGKPVIVFNKSGVAEIIQPFSHGLHLAAQTELALTEAVRTVTKHAWNPQVLRQNAAKYGTSIFVAELKNRLKALWQQHRTQT
jgi:glycosyltransferase involved in cell wall biosynthesis